MFYSHVADFYGHTYVSLNYGAQYQYDAQGRGAMYYLNQHHFYFEASR